MKVNKLRFITTTALVMLMASVFSSGAGAAEKTLGFWFDTDTAALNANKTLTLGSTPESWMVSYTGSATISPTSSIATLTGGFDGSIWKYEYSVNGTDWTTIGTLISNFSGTPDTIGNSKTENVGPAVFVARYLRLGYDVSLSSTSAASTSGSASIMATAVPEPSSILALAGGLVGLLGIRRRKA